MGLIKEFRSSLENPSTPLSFPAEWLLDFFNGGRTDSGIRVSEMTALQVSTVFACVQLISGATGFLDLNVYERILYQDKRAGKRIAYEHDLFDLLENEPNDEMSSFTFRKTLQAHALLWGNLYAEIQRDDGNRPVALWPRNPARIRPYRLTESMSIRGELVPRGALVYKTTEGTETASVDPAAPPYNDGPERTIMKEDILHVPGLSLDGRIAQSTINLARQVVGLALATEKFGSKFFGNGARAGGVFEHPAALKPIAKENLKRSIQEAIGGENVLRPFILEEGMKWHETSTKPNEGQFLETRQFQKSEICSVFLVPPHMVGDTEKTNRANTEQIGIEFVTFTLSPWLKAWRQELKRKLFPKTGRTANKFFAMFDTSPLVMPDAESRRNFYNSGKQWGWLSTNAILEREHMNPIDAPWADGYWMPINMQDAETAFKEPAQGPGPADPAAKSGDDQPDKLGKRFARAYSKLFRDAFGRILSRSSVDSDAFSKAFRPVLESLGDEIYRLAADELGTEGDSGLAESRFLADYIEAMRGRLPEWKSANGEADRLAERELNRAVKAISIEVYRTAGTQRAKQLVEAQP
ncbi:MAG TPA: phage portal protein [Candidatus Acidoferrales bacterium]